MKVVQRKICMLGSFAVGKTSLVRHFVEGRFDDKYLSTIGVKISRRSVEVDDEQSVNLIVWDLAGGDEFLRGNTSYLRGSSGALIICDLTRPQTLQTAEQYAHQIRSTNPFVELIFLGNKVDLSAERQIRDEQLATVAEGFSSPYFLTSAKTGENVELAFALLAKRAYHDER